MHAGELKQNAAAQLTRADFGPGFVWGCSTSAFQIEVAAVQGGRVDSIWDTFCRQRGAIRDASNADTACDHYHRWEQDLDLAASLGVTAYRFSIAWPRIYGDGSDAPNPAGLDLYSRLVDGMLARGLGPWATLYHWEFAANAAGRRRLGQPPHHRRLRALRRSGDALPWQPGQALDHAQRAVVYGVPRPSGRQPRTRHPGPRHRHSGSAQRHGVARPRPASHPRQCARRAGRHYVESSSAAPGHRQRCRYRRVRTARRLAQPLVPRSLVRARLPRENCRGPRRRSPVVAPGDMELIAQTTDFLGVNCYFPKVVVNAPGAGALDVCVVQNEDVERTAFEWEVSPGAMVTLLEHVRTEYRAGPMYLTENGSSYDDVPGPNGHIDDVLRRSYLQRHLAALHQALGLGVPVKGYFYWSLIDNFEWAEAYARRFGLAYVDYATQQRRLKSSGRWYQSFLAKG